MALESHSSSVPLRDPADSPIDDEGYAPPLANIPPVNWWILVSVGCGTFMSALDGSVVNTIQPVLTHALHTNIAMVEWVVTVYLLITSGLLLTVGRWGDVRGHRHVYLLGYVLFVIGSMLCGLSQSIGQLIAFRGAQALGATLLFATAPAIVTLNFPRERRGQALGLQGAMTYLGIATGPLLGGYLATHLGWRSVFYINVPVGLLALGLSWRNVPRMRPVALAGRFDLLGAALFFVALTAFLLPLDQAHAWGWHSLRTVSMIVLSIALMIAFIVVELRTNEPMIDLRLFRNQTFTASTVSSVLNFMTMSALLFLIPYYLIEGSGFSSARTGMLLTALPVPMVIAAPLSGYFSDRIGTRLPAMAGMAIMAVGCAVLSRLQLHSSLLYLDFGLAVAGLGTGIFISPNNSALMGSTTRQQQGIASGVRATARNVGNVLGIGLAGAIFNGVLAQAHVSASRPAMVTHAVDIGMMALVATTLLALLASAMQKKDRAT
jgi:EmrB/QacA subfamily drug resistance transporter